MSVVLEEGIRIEEIGDESLHGGDRGPEGTGREFDVGERVGGAGHVEDMDVSV